MNPLSKVFSIIETVVAGQDKGVIYSEIVAALDLPKSSVHRILKDLTALGYLNFHPETKRYFGSLRLAALGAEVMSNFQLRDHVRHHLLELKPNIRLTWQFLTERWAFMWTRWNPRISASS
jgi:DNA-binding IclR family transcriptional regulator